MESNSLPEQLQAFLLDLYIYRFGCDTMRSPFPRHPVPFIHCCLSFLLVKGDSHNSLFNVSQIWGIVHSKAV